MLALAASSEGSFSHCDDDAWSAVSPDGSFDDWPHLGAIQFAAAREDIFLDGDNANDVFEVLDGIVCAYRILSGGERHILAFYYPGDLIGNCSLATYQFCAQALTPARLRRIPRAVLQQSMTKRPELVQRILRLAALELAATRDHLLCIVTKSAEAKVATFLLALSRRNEVIGGDPRRICLPMTRLDIADYLGLTIETVSRTLSKFKRSGIIELPRATLVILKDTDALARLVNA